MSEFLSLPAWLETFVRAMVKRYITPEQVRAALAEGYEKAVDHLRTLAASTATKLDDLAIAKVDEALKSCAAGGDDTALCNLIFSGEKELVRILRVMAADTKTTLDDMVVDLVAEALGVPKA
jgi:hypothetical protein